MDLATTKITTMALLGSISLVAGMLPTVVMRFIGDSTNSSSSSLQSRGAKKGRLFVSCLSCFAGGVILTTCLTHMMPHVVMDVKQNMADGLFGETTMNLAEIFVLCGFFLIFAVEEVTHVLLDKCCKNGKGQYETGGVKVMVIAAGSTDEEKPMFPMQSENAPDVQRRRNSESAKEAFEGALRGFLVVLALSLHGVFEGMALGLAEDTGSVWFLFFAISSHKYVITFCVGTQLVSSGVRPLLTTIYIATLALISPIGAGIGLGLTETAQELSAQTAVITVLQGLAAGTLIYVVFFEIIEKERNKGTNGLLQITFLLLGFVCILLLELVMEETSNGHQHSHAAASVEAHTASEGDMHDEHDHDEHGEHGPEAPATPLVCLLKFVDASWSFPKYFACDVATKVLFPIEGLDDHSHEDHHDH